MLIDKIDLVGSSEIGSSANQIALAEGNKFVNLVVDSGAAYPSLPNTGELFFKIGTGLSIYDGSSWVTAGSGGGGTPGGSNTQIQFNNAGVFGGISTVTWDSTFGAIRMGTNTAPGAILGKNGASDAQHGASLFFMGGTGYSTGRANGGNVYISGGLKDPASSGDHDGRILFGIGQSFYLQISDSGSLGINATGNPSGTYEFGTAGQVLTSNGSGATPSWTTVSGGTTLPSQTGNSGKYLTTDGSTLSWATVTASGVTTATANTLAQRDSNADLYANNFVSSSDERLKTNIQDIPNALGVIELLNGKIFNWKSTGKMDSGVIAQELEEILPFLVRTDEATGMKSVNYLGIIAYLIEAVKELATAQQQQKN